jgi:hypothetical protein
MSNIPSIAPNLNLNDQSATDDSIKQEGVTIHADNGAVVNTNSQNGRGELTRMWATLITIVFSITCDIALGLILYYGQMRTCREINSKLDSMSVALTNEQTRVSQTQVNLDNTIRELKSDNQRIERQSNEGA